MENNRLFTSGSDSYLMQFQIAQLNLNLFEREVRLPRRIKQKNDSPKSK